jgi:hypothetical protein
LVIVRTPDACSGSNDGELCVQAFLSVRGGAQINRSLFVSDTLTANSNLIAHQDVLQARAGNGTVKAGVVGLCEHGNVVSRPRTFVNVDVSPAPNIVISRGATAGTCSIDFGFEVGDRFIVATAIDPNARGVTITALNGNTAQFQRWDAAGTGQDGSIMVLVY